MKKEDYLNSLVIQAGETEKMADLVFDNCMRQVDGLLSMKEIWDAQKIYITGCGDSWLAGIAAKPAFESLVKIDTRVMRAVDFSRQLSSKNLGYSPNTPLVICVSFSGGAARAVECARRAAQYGANTLAITNNPDSDLAKACRYTLCVGLPAGGEYYPGGTTYNASMIALFVLALRMGKVRRKISPLEYQDICEEFRRYTAACQAQYEENAERAFSIARKWQDLKAEDFVGDYADWATAYFSSAKVVETFGGYTTCDDSEDWCHINYFLLEPERIGRVFYCNKSTPSYGRVLEALEACRKLGSPTIVVTDADRSEFPESFEVFTTPAPKYFWMAPLGQHAPFDMVAGYIAAFKGTEAYRGDCPEFNTDLLNARLKAGTEIVIL